MNAESERKGKLTNLKKKENIIQDYLMNINTITFSNNKNYTITIFIITNCLQFV